jgi:hypothetical protein
MRLPIVNNTIGHPHLRSTEAGSVWVARVTVIEGRNVREFLKRASKTSWRVVLPKDLKAGDVIEFAHDYGSNKSRNYYTVAHITSDLHLEPGGGKTRETSALSSYPTETLLAELARRGVEVRA